jgi:hypothetical protein
MAPLRRGVHRPLEDEANRIIRESLQGVTRHSEKADILTPWKDIDRHRREVYVPSGTPDPALRQGIFHRRINTARPDLNSREGLARGRKNGIGGTLAQHVQEHGLDTFNGYGFRDPDS